VRISVTLWSFTSGGPLGFLLGSNFLRTRPPSHFGVPPSFLPFYPRKLKRTCFFPLFSAFEGAVFLFCRKSFLARARVAHVFALSSTVDDLSWNSVLRTWGVWGGGGNRGEPRFPPWRKETGSEEFSDPMAPVVCGCI